MLERRFTVNHKLGEQRKVVRQWLNPFDPTQLLNQSLDKSLEGTCNWFLEGDFYRWLTGKGCPVLWLRAKRESCLIYSKVTRIIILNILY